MTSNSHAYEFTTFGISIAGGDLRFDEEFKKEYHNGDPFSCGYVVHDLRGRCEESPDHTLPVAWAMGLDLWQHSEQRNGA